jgi:hypothetical protein
MDRARHTLVTRAPGSDRTVWLWGELYPVSLRQDASGLELTFVIVLCCLDEVL